MAIPVQTGLGSISFADIPTDSRKDELQALQDELRAAQINLEESRRDADDNSEFMSDFIKARRIKKEIEDIKGGGFGSIDELIETRTPQAIDVLRGGSAEQLRLARLGIEERLGPLRQISGLEAFDERQALLGLRGDQAQQAAIGGIPVSDFDRELQRRQTQQLRRGAAAAGELGGGASFLAQQQLAGAQQADVIQKRLQDLQPLVALSRSARGDISAITEQGLAQESQLQSSLGSQIGNIKLGAATPAIQARVQEAELRGLQGIARANERGQQEQALVGLVGTLAGSR